MTNLELILKRFFAKYRAEHPDIQQIDLSVASADYDLPRKNARIVLTDNHTTPWDFNLPPAKGSGAVISIYNQSDASVDVNPVGTQTINGANTAQSIATMTAISFVDYASGAWIAVTNASGGGSGDSAYVYIAYASASDGTGFTTTFNAALDYIAIKTTTTEIVTPAASDFTGLWTKYQGTDAPTFYISDTYPTTSDGANGDYWSRYTLICVTPVADPVGDTYAETQSVTLATGTSGATIYYTTNGDTPDSGDTAYTTAISIAATTTLKFIAIKSGYTDSAVVTETYTITA